MLYIVKDYQNNFGIDVDGVIILNNYSKTASIGAANYTISTVVQVYALSQELIDQIKEVKDSAIFANVNIIPIDTKYHTETLTESDAVILDLPGDYEIKMIRRTLALSDSVPIEPFVIGDYDGII